MTGKSSENYGKIILHDTTIRQYHASGMSFYKIGKMIGFDPTSVRERAKQLGLTANIKNKAENHIEEILQLRDKGHSVRAIAKKLGFTHPTISTILQKHDVDTSQILIPRNETFFEVIDTEEKAYCLGLLLSDGYVQYGVIGLTMTDRDAVEKFRNALSYEGQIREIPPDRPNRKLKHECRINSLKLYKDVRRYGIIENKSLTLKFPDIELIPNNLIHHMVRGIHDGDGCLTLDTGNNVWKVAFTGTLEILRGVEIVSGIKLYYDFIGGEDGNTWHAVTRKQELVINILEWMYKDATIYMERKKKKADECLLDLKSRI